MKLNPKEKTFTIKEYKKQISQVTNHIMCLEVERLFLALELQKLQKTENRKLSKSLKKEK